MNKIIATATGLAACLATTAHAGGAFIPGKGSQAQPRAGAFAVKADDPWAIFHNPVGLAKLSGTIIHIGMSLINFSQSFTRAGSPSDGSSLFHEQCTPVLASGRCLIRLTSLRERRPILLRRICSRRSMLLLL